MQGRKGTLILLALALILAGLAAYGAHRLITTRAKEAQKTEVSTAWVVVASRNLPEGWTLTVSDLMVRAWPKASLPKGTFKRVKDLSGRVIKSGIVSGEPILKAKLSPKGLRGGMSAVIAPGMRAVTVRIDDVIGVADFVQPRDRVDVIVTVKAADFSQNPASRMVLEDVEVLAVEKNPRLQAAGKKKKTKSKGQVATLQLKPADAEKLALAATEGKILLTLRNQTDHKASPTKGINLNALIKTQKAIEAEKQSIAKARIPVVPPTPPTVEIIKGTKRMKQRLPK